MIEFRLAPHTIGRGNVVELWYGGRLIGQITAMGEAVGVRVLSKYSLAAFQVDPERAAPVQCYEILIGEGGA